jgi:hypothetical protein
VVVKPVVEVPQAPIASKSASGENLSVYPNPVSDLLNISFNGDIQSIRLMSLDGREIAVSKESLRNKQLDIQHLATGMYFLWVQSGNEWFPVKFSKM